MIHVDLKPEPTDFDTRVRQPGNAFLESCPNPKNKDWSKHNYWNRCSASLYQAYGGICAYCGQWFSKTTAAVSVDHFYPKSTHQELAYEWANYRLTTQTINNYKGDKVNILDPFEIQNGDIIIDFPSCLVKPRQNMAPGERNKAKNTIQILHLNEEDQANQRCEIIMMYINGDVSKQFLETKYPFIAAELHRQNLYEKIKDIIKLPA
ncbi:MAG: hypothetical protein VB086_06710 [Clostridiaceae bacterium]|nr:hypothetical protein [Clostridiaceae bacterium]